MASGLFALPGKKVLVSAESEIETIVVDITEQEVECPKKNRKNITAANENSQTPIKKSKNQKLNIKSKKSNKELAKKRIAIEHINRCLKIFRLLSSRYRNRRTRLNLRLSWLSGIYNYGLTCPPQVAFD